MRAISALCSLITTIVVYKNAVDTRAGPRVEPWMLEDNATVVCVRQCAICSPNPLYPHERCLACAACARSQAVCAISLEEGHHLGRNQSRSLILHTDMCGSRASGAASGATGAERDSLDALVQVAASPGKGAAPGGTGGVTLEEVIKIAETSLIGQRALSSAAELPASA